jgi:hypothetical protein
MNEITLHNITLNEIADSDFTYRPEADGCRKGGWQHPLVIFALEHGGNMCGSCKKMPTCEALGHVAALATFYPVSVRVAKCEWFEKNREGNIKIIET